MAIEIDRWFKRGRNKYPDRRLRLKIGSAIKGLKLSDVASFYEHCMGKNVDVIKDSFENFLLLRNQEFLNPDGLNNMKTWKGTDVIDVLL